MNRSSYRLVFNRMRGMLVPVEETVTTGGNQGGAGGVEAVTVAMALLVPLLAHAQIVPGGGNAPKVISTANGLPQVNVNRPSGAGVSVNTYNQFDVQKNGAILNNSATNTSTQLAGQIAGNPNYAAGQSAKIIVNQVNSANPSQLNGYVEVAGPGATVVLANPSGISVNGGAFINTSRAVLTTGTPNYAPDGSLSGYSITGGTVTVQGAGFNASNVDQVDILARAVQANAAIYAGKVLNVITGANQIDHNTLAATLIAGNGPAPSVSIDLGQMGGMYSGKIFLSSNEYGVGVSTQGVLAAQAGDLTLQSNGQLVMGGQSSASGNVGLTATQGISSTGSTYAGQALSANTGGTLTNSGMMAAQQGVNVGAGSVSSTGALASGVDSSGNLTQAADLNVTASGSLTATGQNVSGGNETLSGNGLTLAGSTTSAAGNLTLNGGAGDANLTGATVAAGSGLNASTAGTLTTDNAKVSSGGAMVLGAGALSNRGSSQLVAGSTLSTNVSGAAVNQGTMQSAAAQSMHAGSLDNEGQILSLNGDGLNLGIVGTLLNGIGAVIGGNGNVSASAYTFTNAGRFSAVANAVLQAWELTNSGQVSAGSALTATATGALVNANGTLSGTTTSASGASINNTKGDIEGTTVSVTTPGDLINQAGTIKQSGTAAQTISAGGRLDNSDAGTIASNATNLTLSGGVVDNDTGTVQHAGTGTLDIGATGANGAVTSVGGNIASNGSANVHGASVDDTHGSMTAKQNLSVQGGSVINDDGTMAAGASATIQGDSVSNRGGSMVAPELDVKSTGTTNNSNGSMAANQLTLDAANLLNRAGTITQYGTATMGLNVSDTLDDTGGTIQTNSTDFTLTPGTLINDDGTILAAGTGTTTIAPGNGAGAMSNVNGKIITAGDLDAQAGSLNNQGGELAAQRKIDTTIAGDANNQGGAVRSLSSLSFTAGGQIDNEHGQIQSGTGAAGDTSTLGIHAATLDDTNGLVSNLGTGDMNVQATTQIGNSGGVITGNGKLGVDTSALVNTQNGQISGADVAVQADTADNSNGQIGNLAGPDGDVSVTTTGAFTDTNGQVSSTHDLTMNAATLTGGGAYSAANDVTVNLQGDFAPTPDVQFNAGHDLTFTLPGTFTNTALVEAVNNLNVNAGDIGNSGVMMAGGTLTTHSDTMVNTGTMVGGSVSLNANSSIQNLGPAALIGASDSDGKLELLAPDIENRDDTTATDTQATTAIFGLGSVVLAGGKDANGNYTSANLIDNRSALIESTGDMTLDAAQVTNTRSTMTTTGLNQSVDPNLLASLGISLSGCTALDMNACSAGHPYVGWATPDNPAFLTMIGGVYTVPPQSGQWNSGYQYTTYTGVALANLIASISPQAQIVAGGNLDASKVGLFQNYWSAVTAVGNIAMPATLDQDSWQGQTAPEIQVTYSGYYHYTNYDHTIADWTLPFGNAPFSGSNPGGYTQAAPADIRYFALPAYESSFVAGGTISGSGISINNTAGNAGIPSSGLAPGQSTGGVTAGSVSGNASGQGGGAGTVSGSGTTDPTIASATAQNVLQNLTVPAGGLFSRASAPGADYLIETNPAFTSQKTFISSDYYLDQLGLNPQTTEKRLGDGFYEQQLVRNQITSLTGKAVLGPYTDLQSMYQSLLAAGASLAQSLDLPLGMSLSPEQVAALTSNVVIMQTEVVDGQSVLVPVVYLAKASQQNMNGPLIAATDIDIQNAQTFTSSGTVQASNTLSIQGQQINNAFGALKSGGLMSLNTVGDVNLTSATVNAGSLAVNAGGNLLLNTVVNTTNQVSATGATRTTTTLGPVASVNVAGNAAIVTGGNLEQNGANLNVGGNLGMAVGGNYDLGSVQTGEHKVSERANGVSNTNVNQTTGSTVNVGGVSQIGVGGDLTATGATLNLAGGGAIAANGNVTFQAAKATSTVDSNSAGSDGHGSYSESLHRSDDTLTATTLNAGDSLTVASGKNINVTGSAISLDKGTATLAAVGDVNIGAATETHLDNSQEQHSHSEIVSSKQVASSQDSTATYSQGSTISADGVAISSGKDINVAGSTIVGTNDVALTAAHDVNVTTTQDTASSQSTYSVRESGFLSGLNPLNTLDGGLQGYSVGVRKTSEAQQSTQVTNHASTVGSINGNLSVQAGNTLHVTGSDLVAGGNVAGVAANVIIDAATDTAHQAQQQKTSSTAVTVGLAGSVGDAINNAVSESQAVGHSAGSGNDRAAALHAIAAAGDTALVGGATDGALAGGKPDIGVKISIGSSHSESQSSEDQTIQRGSNVQAGGTAALVATGDGTSGSGNVTIAGSNVSASDVLLAAKNQVNIVNTTNTDSTRSSNSSGSASVGVQYTLGGGFGISASMANAHGDGNSDAAIQNASHVTGGNSVTVISGGDTNITGSQVTGRQVTADVGGNLNIGSVQDVTNSAAHQSSVSGGFTISQGGGSASFSAQNGHADSNYAGVNEQAGIMAGDGGFNVNVKGNTGLAGAVISSTADASQNSLTTGTLTYSDIANHSHYDANSNGISAGVGFGGNTGKAVGPGSVSGSGGVTPMISQNDSGDSSATTRSAVSAGTINVTNTGAQTQDVAGLSRDTTNTNGTVAKTPDVNNILNQQADTMQAAQAAGQVVSQGIGAYADMKRDDAAAAYKAAYERGDSDGMAAAAADYNNWKEGGDSRAELHVAGGALIGGLGGGSAFSTIGGAAGAGLASKMAGSLNDISKSVASATGSDLIGNLAANVAAGVGGAAVGGTAGAAMASNVHLYNQSVDDERALTGEPGKKSPTLFSLAMQGIANGLSAIIGMGGGVPPASSPGAVLANGAGQALAGAAGSAAFHPDNATLATDPTSRPSGFRKQTVTDAWDNATDGSAEGTKACPTCGKDVTVAPGQGARDWDVDHQPPWSQRDLTGMTRQEVINEYNSGTRLECPSCNRSRGATPAGQ